MVRVRLEVVLLRRYDCIIIQRHYTATLIVYLLCSHTMHGCVMHLQEENRIAIRRFTTMIRAP